MEAAARAEPDSAGAGLDARHQPGERGVHIAAFTGDLDHHRAEQRGLWGGPLYIVQLERSLTPQHGG